MAHTEKITTETPIKNNWFFNSIDGDNAVCDDYGFVLEAPDKETGKKLVTCWNEYDELKAELKATKERESKLEGLVRRCHFMLSSYHETSMGGKLAKDCAKALNQ